VFNHILSKEDCLYNEELDRYLSDLDIFTGSLQLCDQPRDLSDIIFVTDTYSRVNGKHVRNVIPITSFNGTKKDFTLVALSRYLKDTFGPQASTPNPPPT